MDVENDAYDVDGDAWMRLRWDPEDVRNPADIIMGAWLKDAVEQRAKDIRIHREATRLVNAEETNGRGNQAVRASLREELELPDDDELYAIDRLLPLGGNALFAARYKAGKTVFSGNLLKSWADGQPYLGLYRCKPDPDRPVVTIFNYEMSRSQFRRWLRKFGIVNQDLVHVVHLRGVSLPLGLPDVREEVAGWLRDANTGLWIVDPASRAMAGMGDGSDNKDVNEFTGYLDEIKADAGVRDMLLTIHMGHAASQDKNAERALGAQAWSAWADALWFLKMDENKQRYFKAYGRDVDVDEMAIQYDPETMSISSDGMDADQQRAVNVEDAVLKVVAENPGITMRGIRDEGQKLIKTRLNDFDYAARKLAGSGKLSTKTGPRNSIQHFLASEVPTLPNQDQ